MVIRQLIIVFILVVLSWPTCAQDNTQVALQRAQAMLRKISGQKAALEAQVQQLQQQVEIAQSDLEAQKNKSERKENKFKGAISEWKEEYGILREKFLELAGDMRKTVTERDELSEKIQVATRNFLQCYSNNGELVRINEKLLTSYEKKGIWASLSQREPVTGLGKVEMENLLQTYRHDINDMDLSMNHQLIDSER